MRGPSQKYEGEWGIVPEGGKECEVCEDGEDEDEANDDDDEEEARSEHVRYMRRATGAVFTFSCSPVLIHVINYNRLNPRLQRAARQTPYPG